ncbi:MAG: hypothetical protein KDD40_07465 [Bdellovibrionales bacterium]|nr:hypothetical protein [Bdellovibrionales bacterium]
MKHLGLILLLILLGLQPSVFAKSPHSKKLLSQKVRQASKEQKAYAKYFAHKKERKKVILKI